MSSGNGVAVIGGGPAGCAAAATLGRAGIRTVVYEAGAPGKDKPCGDALVPAAIDALGDLGITEAVLAGLGGVAFDALDFVDRDQARWRYYLQFGRGWIVRRAALDQALRNATATVAEVTYGAKVVGITEECEGGELRVFIDSAGKTTEFHPDGIVLATGALQKLSRKWGVDGKPLRGIAFTAYLHREPPEVPRFGAIPIKKMGYGWEFPVGATAANVGVCSFEGVCGRELRRTATEYGASEAGVWRGGVAPVWSGQGAVWHHERGVISCGDCAGIADPTSGEGISVALRTGIEAGRTMANYIAGERCGRALEGYSSWVRESLSALYGPSHTRSIWAALCAGQT